MSIQYKFLFVPAVSPEEAEAQLNSLLRSVRLLNIDKEFVSLGERSFWSVAVSFIPGGKPGEKAEGAADRKKNRLPQVLRHEPRQSRRRLEQRPEERAGGES